MFREDINVLSSARCATPRPSRTAVTAAETGHLILSTLHTNNAAQTIDRIIDSFPATQQDQIRVQLAGVLDRHILPAPGAAHLRRPHPGLRAPHQQLGRGEPHPREAHPRDPDGHRDRLSEGMIDMNRSLADLVRRGEITRRERLPAFHQSKDIGETNMKVTSYKLQVTNADQPASACNLQLATCNYYAI